MAPSLNRPEFLRISSLSPPSCSLFSAAAYGAGRVAWHAHVTRAFLYLSLNASRSLKSDSKESRAVCVCVVDVNEALL